MTIPYGYFSCMYSLLFVDSSVTLICMYIFTFISHIVTFSYDVCNTRPNRHDMLVSLESMCKWNVCRMHAHNNYYTITDEWLVLHIIGKVTMCEMNVDAYISMLQRSLQTIRSTCN